MNIPKNNDLLDNAKKLRRDMVPHERKLWYLFLRKYPVKIYKQRIIGSYIVDFYCASAKLVIELDGSQHYDERGLSYDAERSAFLESLGLKVLRFSNADINRRFQAVCEQIDMVIRERSALSVTACGGASSPGGSTPSQSRLRRASSPRGRAKGAEVLRKNSSELASPFGGGARCAHRAERANKRASRASVADALLAFFRSLFCPPERAGG